jgi:hypothetical protein
VLAKEAAIHQLVQEQVNQKLATVASFVPIPTESIADATTGPIAAIATTLEGSAVVPDLVQVAISPENLEAVKTFLAEKTNTTHA